MVKSLKLFVVFSEKILKEILIVKSLIPKSMHLQFRWVYRYTGTPRHGCRAHYSCPIYPPRIAPIVISSILSPKSRNAIFIRCLAFMNSHFLMFLIKSYSTHWMSIYYKRSKFYAYYMFTHRPISPEIVVGLMVIFGLAQIIRVFWLISPVGPWIFKVNKYKCQSNSIPWVERHRLWV